MYFSFICEKCPQYDLLSNLTESIFLPFTLLRLMSLNENLKTKLDELEAARDALDKTDIEAKLDELRREKDGLGRALMKEGILIRPKNQCWGSETFYCGSGSADPYWYL
jgi:hypothetical protein